MRHSNTVCKEPALQGITPSKNFPRLLVAGAVNGVIVFSLVLLIFASYAKLLDLKRPISVGSVGIVIDLAMIVAISVFHRHAFTRVILSAVFLCFLLTHAAGIWEKVNCGCLGGQKWTRIQMLMLTGFMSISWSLAALAVGGYRGSRVIGILCASLILINFLGIGFSFIITRTETAGVVHYGSSRMTWSEAKADPSKFLTQVACRRNGSSRLFFVVNPFCYDCRGAARLAEEFATANGMDVMFVVPHGYPYTPSKPSSNILICQLKQSVSLSGFPSSIFKVQNGGLISLLKMRSSESGLK